MLSTLNQVIIEGKVGNKPEFRATTQGQSIVVLLIVTEDTIFDKQKTQWHHVIVSNETLIEKVRTINKGSRVIVRGLLHVRKEGQGYMFKQSVEIIVDKDGSLEIVNVERDIPPPLYDT